MIFQGNILKMQSRLADVVQYALPLGEHLLAMNDLIGKEIKINFLHRINCIKCGKKTQKSFNQGYCYSCFLTAPENDPGVYHPELDQAHLGISRDMEYAKHYSLVPHSVYLSLTSGVKVGVTRTLNIFTRWIDQGAIQGLRIAETPYRNLAGLIEVELKNHFDDRTQWQAMLTNRIEANVNLISIKKTIRDYLPDVLKPYYLDHSELHKINYPVTDYPIKVKSMDLEKNNEFKAKLTGIKGQYLLFGSMVINIRKYQGYMISLEAI